MAHHKSAIKRIRQTARRTARRRIHTTKTRTMLKAYRSVLESGDKDKAMEELPTMMSQLNKAAQKGVFSKKTASRRIGRLAAAQHKMAAKA